MACSSSVNKGTTCLGVLTCSMRPSVLFPFLFFSLPLTLPLPELEHTCLWLGILMSISFQELMQIPLCESAGKWCWPSNLPRVVPKGRACECVAASFPGQRIKGQGVVFQCGVPCLAWIAQTEPPVQQGYLNNCKWGMTLKNVNLHQDGKPSGSGGSLLTACAFFFC